MALTKLLIEPLRWDSSHKGLVAASLPSFEVPFNPTSYSVSKTVSWSAQTSSAEGNKGDRSTTRELDAPPLQFGGGGSRTLDLRLFFDVTEGGPDGQTRDVRVLTNQLLALTRIERDQHRPPVCRLSWGSEPPSPPSSQVRADFPFVGVVTSLTQDFVLFRETGEPLRANVTLVITEYIDPQDNKRVTDPDLTTHQVRRGDSLASIAARWYGNPAAWRLIAIANGLDDPRQLVIGARLVIPKAGTGQV